MKGVLIQGALRMNRVIAISLLCPNNKLVAVACSEIGSVIFPYINPLTQGQALGIGYSIIYAPQFANYLINLYTKKNILIIRVEIILITILIIYINSFS